MMKEEKQENKRQFLTIDITNPDDIKSDINVSGISNQQIMISCLSQVISQMSEKTRGFYNIIQNSISNFEDDGKGNAENAIMVLKQVVRDR